MNILNWFGIVWLDLRYSLRQFWRYPLFSAVAVLSLGLGIGAPTAIFALIDTTLLSTLPVHDPQSLAMLTSPNEEGRSTGFAEAERQQISYPEFVQLRDRLTSISDLCAADSSLDEWQVRIQGREQETVSGKLVSENYFSVLGVNAVIGRLFDSQAGLAPVRDPYVVLSYAFWKRRFGAQPGVLGSSIRMNGANLTVIGVAGPLFKGESVGQNPDLWIPMMMQPAVYPGRDWLHEDPGESMQKVMWLNAFARLKPGASLRTLQSEVDVVFHRMLRDFYGSALTPELTRGVMSQHLVVRDARTGTFPDRDEVALRLKILLAATAFVLLIACANVGNLLLGKATRRDREISVRLSIGGSRQQICRQLFIESLVLWAFGGIAGIIVAVFTSQTISALVFDPRQGSGVASSADWRSLAFPAAITLITGLLFGALPAQRALGADINRTLRETSGAVSQSGRRVNVAKMLVAGQVALSFLLSVGAGLLVRTLMNLEAMSLGYPKDRLLQVDVDGVSAGYKDQGLVNFYGQLADRLSAVPGVRGVAYSNLGLLTGGESQTRIRLEGDASGQSTASNRLRSHFDYISPGYFSVLGVPLVLGRDIGLEDSAASRRVAVINEAFARQFFAGQNPLGRRISAISGKNSTTLEIVGVVKDVRSGTLRGEIPPIFYAPVRQTPFGKRRGAVVFQILTAQDPNFAISGVRAAINAVNPDAPILLSQTIRQSIADQTSTERRIARVCSLFCLLALLLAAVGLYGVFSDTISRRSNEIGIRMAIGARPGDITRMVLGETALLTAIGSGIGLLAAAVSTRVIASYLFGLSRMDYLTIAFAFVLVTIVALAAGYLPAVRASRINPIKALRQA